MDLFYGFVNGTSCFGQKEASKKIQKDCPNSADQLKKMMEAETKKKDELKNNIKKMLGDAPESVKNVLEKVKEGKVLKKLF